MSRNARQRKRNRGASIATATATATTRPAMSVGDVGTQQAQRTSAARGAQRETNSTSPQPSSQPVVAVAIELDAASGDDSQHVGELLVDRLRRWLSVRFSRAGLIDDVRRHVTLTRTIVARYVRSGWFVAEVASIAGLFALCFGTPFDAAYFYRIAGLALGLFAVVATYGLDHVVASPRWYVRRSLRTLDRPTVAPLVFAATITRVAALVLLLLLVLGFRRLTPIEPRTLLAGAVGLLANCVLIAAVSVACSTPFARREVQLGVLGWLVAALATYGPGTIFAAIPIVSWLLRLPLLPFAVCYGMGVTGTPGWSGVAALVAEAGMVAATVAITDSRLRRRFFRRERVGAAR